jgi:hypothetical protein
VNVIPAKAVDGTSALLYALCGDGSLWALARDVTAPHAEGDPVVMNWVLMPEVPQGKIPKGR